ncbi:MAG: HAMP domain-containing protein [Deltaproteobacteria bacterium]|nr:HAMP domain-containing protein [Deltaproteobacteria bacterium]
MVSGIRDKDTIEELTFPGRINRRLSLLFGFLVFLVLLAGGVSLYLSYSISLGAETIRWESQQIDVADRIHSTIHHFLAAIQRAKILGKPIPDGERAAYLPDLIALLELERYHDTTEEREVVLGIRNLISELRGLADKAPDLNPRDLEALADAELRVQGFAHLLSAAHRVKMAETLRENTLRMQLIVGLYAGFAFLGVVLIMGASFLFYRTLSQPLRSLARAASEFAEGNLHKEVPVTSKDEIGELSHAFNVMAGRLKEHEERLKDLARLEERERLAHEIHDSLAQNLALLHLKVAEAERDCRSAVPAAITKGTLSEMRQIVDLAYDDVQRAIRGLRNMVSKSPGLIPTLTEYLHEFGASRGIPVDLRVDGPEAIRLSPKAETELVRIIHEALTSALKHSAATRSEVRFARVGNYAKVTIEDNGKGFLVGEISGTKLHFCLHSMKERAESVGGKLDVDSAPGKGTRVIVFLPVAEGPQ